MVHKEFDQARTLPENQDPVRKFALDQAEGIVLAAGVKWPVAELQQATSAKPATEAAPRIEVKSPFEQLRESWVKESHTPEFMTQVSKRIWEEAGRHIMVPFTRPDAFPASQKDLSDHEVKGEVPLFLPIELATPEGRFHLGQAFKMLGNIYVPDHWSVQKANNVKNNVLHAGWRYVSAQVDAPNLDTSATKAKKDLLKDGYEGIDENEYLALGLFMKTTQDAYPDQERAWTWLLNSSQGRRLVNARFARRGGFHVHSDLRSDYHHPALGVRLSSGVKKS